jgi:hypothetical protein
MDRHRRIPDRQRLLIRKQGYSDSRPGSAAPRSPAAHPYPAAAARHRNSRPTIPARTLKSAAATTAPSAWKTSGSSTPPLVPAADASAPIGSAQIASTSPGPHLQPIHPASSPRSTRRLPALTPNGHGAKGRSPTRRLALANNLPLSSALTHAVQKLRVVPGLLQPAREQLHRFDRREGIQHTPQDPDALQVVLRNQQLFLTRA